MAVTGVCSECHPGWSTLHRVATAQRCKEREELRLLNRKMEHHHRNFEEIFFFFLFYLCDLPGWGTPAAGHKEMAQIVPVSGDMPCSPLHGLFGLWHSTGQGLPGQHSMEPQRSQCHCVGYKLDMHSERQTWRAPGMTGRDGLCLVNAISY